MVRVGTAFSSVERERIGAAVTAMEERTGARCALAIVRASDRYLLVPIVWAALLALSATGVLALLRPDLTIGDGVLVDAGLFLVLGLGLDWWPLRLRLVPPAIKRSHARRLAHREFAARILADAQHRDGVLFFISLGERYVEVIATRELHHRVPPGTWEAVVAGFIAAVREKRVAEGFVAAVEACSATLQKSPSSDDRAGSRACEPETGAGFGSAGS